jgi:predicted flap endonuclease-1-like 5' DNA nuclease
MVAESEACGEIRTLGEQARREKERERERETERERERQRERDRGKDDRRTTQPIGPVYREELTGQGCLVRGRKIGRLRRVSARLATA